MYIRYQNVVQNWDTDGEISHMIWKLKLIMYKVHCFWHSGLSPTSPPQWQNVMQYIILNLLQYVNIVITNIYIDITISECNLYYRYMYHKILISICKKIPESNINIDIRIIYIHTTNNINFLTKIHVPITSRPKTISFIKTNHILFLMASCGIFILRATWAMRSY